MSKFVLRYHDGLPVGMVGWDKISPNSLTEQEKTFLRDHKLGHPKLRADRNTPVMFWPTKLSVQADGGQKWFSICPATYNSIVQCNDLAGNQYEVGTYLLPVRENISRNGKKLQSIGWASVVAVLRFEDTDLQTLFQPWRTPGMVDFKREADKFISSTLLELLRKVMEYVRLTPRHEVSKGPAASVAAPDSPVVSVV